MAPETTATKTSSTGSAIPTSDPPLATGWSQEQIGGTFPKGCPVSAVSRNPDEDQGKEKEQMENRRSGPPGACGAPRWARLIVDQVLIECRWWLRHRR